MKNLKDTLFTILKKDSRLWNEDNTELNETLLFDLVDKVDETIIDILLQEDETRTKFFIKVKDVYVFKSNEFKFFLEENKIDNSYTYYKNRIGLSSSSRLLKENSDVVLDFPFKDCVLEGGQSTEEGMDTYFEYDEKLGKKEEKLEHKPNSYNKKQSKRKEVFFNQILAQDEIDRLFDEKALVNWQRFTKEGEEQVKEIKRDEEGVIRENILIKGNNLLALHSLKKQFAGNIKFIYIDPPYNTSSDSFKYNDKFNHSTWLTFMKNRLKIAKKLLRHDGVIFVQCDDHEQAYLKVLMDEIFKKNNFVETYIWKNTDNAPTLSKKTRKNIEFIHCYEQKLNPSISYIGKQSNNDDAPLLNSGNPYKEITFPPESIHFNISDKTYKKGAYERVEVLNDFTIKKGKNVESVIMKGEFKWSQSTLNEELLNGTYFLIKSEKFSIRYQRKDGGNVAPEKYLSENYLSKALGVETNEDSKKHIDSLGVDFPSYPKPESLIAFLIKAVTNEGDIILDFFGGSGTTGAVAHKMNRQYILIEQMDYIKELPQTRLKKVIEGEQGGISKSVNWKGGGDFIYCELAQWNEKAKEEILNCKSLEELIQLFDILYEKYFLNYNVRITEFREKIVKEENFKNLSLDEQRSMFVTMLDLNQMYVQRSEIEDKRFNISQEDQKLTSDFYNDK